MKQSAVLTIRHFHLAPSNGRPDSWIWSLTPPEGRGAEFQDVRVADPRDLEALYELPARIAELRRAGARNAVLEKAVEACAGWITRTGLGGMAERIEALAPVVVEFRLPPEVADLEVLPWELALVRGVPLARRGVVFVRGVRRPDSGPVAQPSQPSQPPGSLPPHLRMLALFSMPSTSRPVDLGAHRTLLRAELLDLTAGAGEDAVPLELRTRQFGVSRETLKGMLREPGGWDVVHVVAHGRPGGLTLERADGTADKVGARDLLRLLDPARGRTRLVFLSACWSGSRATEEDNGDGPSGDTAALGSLAGSVAEHLGCAVVAMRFPVSNDFARALAVRVYRHLLCEGHELPQALHNAVADSVTDIAAAEGGTPLFTAATPVLFGAAARTLRLPGRPMTRGPMRGVPVPAVGGLPERPRSFVGRQREMTGASAALAPESGLRGAVIHGVEGMGATTCASLLAHDHREAFDIVLWHPRPVRNGAGAQHGAGSFDDLLRNVIVQIPGIGVPSGQSPLSQWRELVDKSLRCHLRLLLVLDAVDRAIDLDPRFVDLIEQFTGVGGTSRILLTSRSELPGVAPELPRTELPALDVREVRQIVPALPRLGVLARERRNGVLLEKALRGTRGRPGLLMDAEGHAATVRELENWIRRH